MQIMYFGQNYYIESKYSSETAEMANKFPGQEILKFHSYKEPYNLIFPFMSCPSCFHNTLNLSPK